MLRQIEYEDRRPFPGTSEKHRYMLEHPSISHAARYGVRTISRKGPASSLDYAADSSETLRHGAVRQSDG